MMRDLLRIVVEQQWQSDAVYMGRGEYADGCPTCEASDELTVGESIRHEGKRYERDTHKPGCRVDALIREVRGFLSVEDPEGDVP